MGSKSKQETLDDDDYEQEKEEQYFDPKLAMPIKAIEVRMI
jgi:hypothetical protein